MKLWGHWSPLRPRRGGDNEDIGDALWEAHRALQDAKQLRTRADSIGERLRETGRNNHFGDAVKRALRGEL